MLLQAYLSETRAFATSDQRGVVQRSVPQQWVEQTSGDVGSSNVAKTALVDGASDLAGTGCCAAA